MKFTGQEEYGLRCILQVARYSGDDPITIAEIAEREGLSVPYVAKLMALLRRSELVRGVRGRKGGYVLGHAPDQITVADVLAVLGDQLYEAELCDKWTGEMKICVHNTDCTIRTMWKGLERMIVETTGRITLSHLIGNEQDAAAHLKGALNDSSVRDHLKMILPS